MEEKNLTRIIEALLFANNKPLSLDEIATLAQENNPRAVEDALASLQETYVNRGINLVLVDERYEMRTAPDLAEYLTIYKEVRKKLSRAALETLAIVSYHQPVTRGDIEEIRGVSISKGTLDLLLEHGWIQPKGRKQVPGRPLTWGTTTAFLRDFGLENLDALPGLEDLRSAGLLDKSQDQLILKELSANDNPDEEGDDPAEYEEDGSQDAAIS